MEGGADASVPAEVGGGETPPGRVEVGADPLTPAASCGGKGRLNGEAEPPAPTPASPPAESAAGVALKMAAAVLRPLCLGDGPLMLPIHLQVAGAAAAGSQLGPMGAAPYLIASQNPVSLPLVLDQQVLQHMSPSVVPQAPGCPQLQGAVLRPNPFSSPPPAADQKSAGQTQDANLLSLLQNPAFAAILEDLLPSQAGSAYFPLPPLAAPYVSPLAPLVPPATLLVPYPVIIPLPVPLPIPLPVPVPVPQAEDSKGNVPKPVCTASKSTQTSPSDSPPPPRRCVPSNACPSSSASEDEGQALDLSLRACPVEPKQEYPSPQPEDVLDLSVPAAARKRRPDAAGPSLSLGVHCEQSLDSKLLGGLGSLEFSRQHKWVVDSGGAGTLEVVGARQAANVIVSVKDAIPAVFCGKIKGISGVSTKNFSIKRDSGQGASAPASPHEEQHHAGKKPPKNRAVKPKKVGSQEIHFLPIKKQRLPAPLPRK